MENTRKGTSVHKMLDIIVRIVGIVVSIIATIVRVIDIVTRNKNRHQKSS